MARKCHDPDDNVAFYLGDLLDWRAGLTRLGFIPNQRPNAYTLFIRLAESLPVEQRTRHVSHCAIRVGDESVRMAFGRLGLGVQVYALNASYYFGYPTVFPMTKAH